MLFENFNKTKIYVGHSIQKMFPKIWENLFRHDLLCIFTVLIS